MMMMMILKFFCTNIMNTPSITLIISSLFPKSVNIIYFNSFSFTPFLSLITALKPLHKYSISSSSRHTDGTKSYDSLSISVPIGHRSLSVLKMAPSFRTKLMNVSLHWSSYTGVSMCWSISMNVTNEFIITSVVERIIFSCVFCFTAKLSWKIYIQLCVRFIDKSPRDLRFKNALSDARV